MRLHASAFKILVLFVLVVAVSVIVGCAGNETDVPTPAPASGNGGSSADPAPVPAAPVTSDDPKSLVELKCSMCHSLDRVWSADYDQAEWTSTVDRMKRNGLVITDEEYTTIIDYLAE